MPNFAGKVAGNFLAGVFESLSEEHKLGIEVRGAELRPLSFGEALEATDVDPVPQARATPAQQPDPLLLLSFTPTRLGDILGLGLDAAAFASGDLEPTAGNVGLAGLGLLPFVPPALAVKKTIPDSVPFFKKRIEEVKKSNFKVIAAKKELGRIKAEAAEFLPERGIAEFDLSKLKVSKAGVLTMTDEAFIDMITRRKFKEKLADLVPEDELRKFKELTEQANKQADLVDEILEEANVQFRGLIDKIDELPDSDKEGIFGLIFGPESEFLPKD